MKLRRTSTLNGFLQGSEPPGGLDLDAASIGDDWIDHNCALRLARAHALPLSDLLRGTEAYVGPGPAAKPKTQEYVLLMQKLRNAEEERKYKSLLGDSKSSFHTLNLKSVSDEINDQLTTIFNVLVSVGAVGWAFWYWCSNWSLGGRTLTSLFAAGLAGVAEVVVYSGYLRRVEGAKRRSIKQAESQRVIKEWVFEGGRETVRKLDPEYSETDSKKQEGHKNDITGQSEGEMRYRGMN